MNIHIPGLNYIEEYIDIDSEERLLASVDLKSWQPDLKRRVQHYGYTYD